MLVLTRRTGDAVEVEVDGRVCEVKVLSVKGRKVRLGFVAPPEVRIRREEVEPEGSEGE